jgi:hypothetical protein
MELTCTFCNKPFNVNPAEAASAVIDYTFGKKTHNFKCDNCGKDNPVTKIAYEAAKDLADKPKPVAGAKPVAKPVAQPVAPKPVVKPVSKPVAPKPVAPQPVSKPAPVAAPRPIIAAKRKAICVVQSLHVRKDHSTKAETMAGLSKGEKVEVLSTWTDGKNTWVEIGPERWCAMIYNGDTLMEYES